ncbi:hypothetical protein B0T20DRAFT_473643 [Sordaria brevicollis]|uniref:Uncharacterized protein n=1 Tax=Sordaria brevicollis TaxID=83679 RepID=A0AAE0NVR7_SORBR|nr:hypothetical protein B0T20DRAFT_473643 [Sordaria brevicollis]
MSLTTVENNIIALIHGIQELPLDLHPSDRRRHAVQLVGKICTLPAFENYPLTDLADLVARYGVIVKRYLARAEDARDKEWLTKIDLFCPVILGVVTRLINFGYALDAIRWVNEHTVDGEVSDSDDSETESVFDSASVVGANANDDTASITDSDTDEEASEADFEEWEVASEVSDLIIDEWDTASEAPDLVAFDEVEVDLISFDEVEVDLVSFNEVEVDLISFDEVEVDLMSFNEVEVASEPLDLLSFD